MVPGFRHHRDLSWYVCVTNGAFVNVHIATGLENHTCVKSIKFARNAMVNDGICFRNIYKNDKIALINASSAKGVAITFTMHDCILQQLSCSQGLITLPIINS